MGVVRALRARRVVGLFLAGAAMAGTLAAVLPPGGVPADSPQARTRTSAEAHFHVGEEIARTVSVATGVPISPLLGVSALGFYRWYAAPAHLHPSLPWYARPWFWGSGLALTLLFALNTTIGGLVPGLKKPMDFVEEHENKFSALVASPIVLLEVHRLLTLAEILPRSAAATALGATGLAATADGGAAWNLLVALGLGAVYLTVFVVVFLAFHAIQVLIALSPSTLLDLMLRGFRFSMLVASAAAAAVHPYVGAAYALLLLFACALVAGWSFRLTVYGSVLSWEFLAGRAGTADPRSAPLLAFAGKGLAGPPLRSLGRIEPTPLGGWCFRWRPWLVLPSRREALGDPSTLSLVRGALSPRLIRTGPVRETTLARFAPRFRGKEDALASHLGAADVRDGRIVRGLKAAWRYVKEVATGTDTADPALGPGA